MKLPDIIEELTAVFGDKSPSAKVHLCLFTDKFVKLTYIDDLTSVYPELIKMFVAGANDMNGDVRDAALTSIGVILGRLKVSGSDSQSANC